MSTRNEHIAQAKHNCDLVSLLSNSGDIKKDSRGIGFSDWHTTVAFYAAIHYLEAFLGGGVLVNVRGSAANIRIKHSADLKTTLGTESEHSIRKTILLCNSGDGKLFTASVRASYLTLYEDSRHARYDCYECSQFSPKNAEFDLMTVQNFCVPD